MSKQRLFYDMKIRVQRVEANIDDPSRKPLDTKHDVGLRVLVDDTLAEKGDTGVFLKSILTGLRAEYGKRVAV